ncbi:MAG: hypothetical protein HY763_03040 [Planctomycetes bacterium]|nr:hypothetical protein [Planctomycetota bacterium]
MPFHLYKAVREGAESAWFGIRVEFEDDRWVASCRRVDAQGRDLPELPAVAPKFYGVTAEQAQRRMLAVLENSYDELAPLAAEGTDR